MYTESLRDRIRVKWADTILGVAESLPTFNAGIVSHLQFTRKDQREQSEREFGESRLPEGSTIRLCGTNLLRLYPLEDLEVMESLLRRWFPKASGDPDRRIGGDAESLTGVSWSYVGHVARRASGFFPGEVAVLDDLPSEIEHISVGVQKVLPSLRVLVFGVTLAGGVSTELLKLHQARYFGRITFNRWIPSTFRFWGMTYGSPEAARQRAIYDYVENVRSKVKRFITRHFPGPPHPDPHHFVVLDDFHLSADEPAAATPAWPGAWGWQFGLRSWGYNLFRSDVARFLAAEEESGMVYPHRLIVNGDPQPGDIANSGIESAIHDLVPFLTLLDILSDSEDSVGKLRLQVFKGIARSGVMGWFWRRTSTSFYREIRLNSTLQMHRMLLDRLGLEYRQQKDLYASWCGGLKRFINIGKQDLNLLDSFQGTIARRIVLVSEHIRLASESFSSHVSARNLDITYRLGRKVLLLTLIVTVLGVLENWPAISCALRWLRQYLFR
jgi:hypothetical protein